MRFNLKLIGGIIFALVFLVGGFLVIDKVYAIPSAPGDVIINEFSSNPSSESEWVELLNTTQASIDITGWKIKDFTFSSGSITGTHDNLIGSVTIPANGIVVIEVTGLNNDADSIILSDNSATPVTIHNVVYGTVATQTTTTGLETAPAAGESAAFYAGSWHVNPDNTPTKGWFNDTSGGAPLWSTITSSFCNPVPGPCAVGIASNITSADNPSAISGLYFEKTGMGKISLANTINMTDQAVVATLSGLGDDMEMSAGHIEFDSATASAMNAAGATLYMYGLTQFNTEPNLIVKNDGGTVIAPEDTTNYPTIVKSWNNTDKTLSFTTSHFTQFDIDNNIYVNASNTGTENGTLAQPYNTISEGINAAAAGGTVNIAAGTYTESFTINKSITITGAGSTTIINPPSGSPAFDITTNDVTIKNLKINALEWYGIALKNADNVELNNIVIDKIETTVFLPAIYIYGSSDLNGGNFGNSNNFKIYNSTINSPGNRNTIYAAPSIPAHTGWIIGSIGKGNAITSDGSPLELHDVTNSTVSYNTITGSTSSGTNAIWTSELSNISDIHFENNIVGTTSSRNLRIVPDWGYPTQDNNPTTMDDVNIIGNTFSNWGTESIEAGALGRATNVKINGNKFNDTDVAIRNLGTTQINATNNWWGSANLATVTAKIDGDINFKPYYTTDSVDGTGALNGPLSDLKALQTFNFQTPSATGIVNETDHTIAVTVPITTNRSALVANFTTTGSSVAIGANAQVSGTTANDFTSAKTYTVTAQDGTTVDYTVTVSLASPDPISISAIAGVTAPARSATPVSAITETAQYTGTVSWSPSATTFAPSTVYTATITLTPKTGYTLTGVSANFFTVTGATATNGAGSGVVTAVFPSTAAIPSIGGSVSISGTAKYGQTLTANIGSLTNAGTPTYQWNRYSEGTAEEITGATSSTYVLTQNEIGKTVSVTARAENGVGTGTVESTKTITVTKADGPAAPNAPTLASKTTTSITLTENALNQFSKDNGSTWQDSNVFSGLTASTIYSFVTRVKATTTANESLKSIASSNITTNSLENQIIADEEVTVNTTQKEVVVNSNTATTITIPSGVSDATINVDSLATDNGTTTVATLPAITLNVTTSLSTTPVKVEIPTGAIISALSTDNWDGTINAPTIKENSTVTATPDDGMTSTVSSVIEVGYGDVKLVFDKAVRILIPGQAGKYAGYSRSGVFTEITNTCAIDNQATGDALVAEGDCKIDVGSDLVIWTKHFTKFATYTQSTTSGGSSGSIMPVALIKGDINNDNRVDRYDFALMMSSWGKIGINNSDLNKDNKVDKYDFALLMLNWSK